MIIIPKARISEAGSGTMTIIADPVFDPEIAQAMTWPKGVHVTISRVRQGKKTGEGSRNNLIHLWFRQIADQISAADPLNPMDEEIVKQAMKRMAVDEGWPTCLNPLDGKEEPVGIRWASEDHMALLVRVVEMFAALNGINLTKEEQDAE